MKYSMGFRASVVKKTLDGSGKSVSQVARETGISAITISNWIGLHKAGTLSLDGCDSLTPAQRGPGEKLSLLLESRTVSEDQRGEWLRQQGMHSESLPLWEQELTSIMNDKQTNLRAEITELKKDNKELRKELERQKEALVEAAILLTLKKSEGSENGAGE
ncbi:MAG: transposase [Spirochaetota bacterium]